MSERLSEVCGALNLMRCLFRSNVYSLNANVIRTRDFWNIFGKLEYGKLRVIIA